MTALGDLYAYLRRLERKLRVLLASRGAAIVAGSALSLTLLLVWIGNRYEFAHQVVFPLRFLLFLCLAAAVTLGVILPLVRFTSRRVTALAERQVPGFEQRLLTVTEHPDRTNPFLEVVAEDALRIAKENRINELASSRRLVAYSGSAAVAAAVLVWLIAAGPGYWGYGASLLWTGEANQARRPLYDIVVHPGNKTVRRKSDQLVTAKLMGFSSRSVTLYAKYASATKWEQIAMQPAPGENGYRFVFAALSEPIEYYVQANAAKSPHYQLAVKDLPSVKRVRVTLRFPSQLGLRDVVNDPGGDVRAVQGSRAEISVLTDRPLEHGVLVLDDGSQINLTRTDGADGAGNWLNATLAVEKDGAYHVAAIDGNEAIRISDDYFIEAKKDEPPSVRILHPGRDPHVSPIEEVPVTVEAADDFGLEGLELHYSVNGGPEQTVSLLKDKGVKEAQGRTTLYLEDFKLVPGDIVSFYASAKDANVVSRSDIVFAQAEPFDFKFRQSQQAGGGMGMGGGQGDDLISERQKQIIAATWNELKGPAKDHAAVEEDARFLSDLQDKLRAQAKTLADRMGNRELTGTNPEFENFSKMMTLASSQMADSTNALKPGKWQDALPPEQKALQSLLRAEALFRDIQVAFGQGGGMGGSGAQRDLARMFDLELDTSKNQYETEQSSSPSGGNQQKAIDEAFQKLQELARRQQELAEQHSPSQQAIDQRWQEEQLRREAEDLRKQLQQLSQNASNQSGTPSGESDTSQSTAAGGRAGRAGRGQMDQKDRQMEAAMRQAMQSLQRAEDEMRRSVSDHDSTARQRAATQLAEAQNALNNALQQRAGSSVSDLADRAQQIASSQEDLARRMKQLYGRQTSKDGVESESSSTLGGESEMPEMNDPENPRYGYGYRRRYWSMDMSPRRPATEQEKSLANEKDRLAEQLQQLQRQMQQQQQSLSATQPAAASQLQKALSDAEQKELALRMQKNAEWLRKGYGDRNVGMEDSVTAGVQELSHDLQGVQQTLKANGAARQDGTDGGKTSDALAQVESLRQMLESAQQQRAGNQQRGGEGQQSGQSLRGGASQNGSFVQFGAGNPALDPNNIDDTIRELNALRNQLGTKDRPLYNYIDGTLGYLRDLKANPGVLQSTIGDDAVASLERLEVELSQRAVQRQTLGARSGARESAPEKYQDAVAEYFKKLSQPKTN